MLNLSALKNVLTGLTPAPPSEIPSAASVSASTSPDAVRAQVDMKQKQLRRGTTKAEVERRTAERDVARVALVQSERVAADEDSTTAIQRMTRAEDDLRDKEKELTIAIRKDEAAQADLANAKRQASIEEEFAALEDLRLEGLWWDQKFVEIEARIAHQLSPKLNRTRIALGGSIEANYVEVAKAGFGQCVANACSSLIKPAGTYSCLHRDKMFSYYCPDPALARTRKRK